MTYKICTSTQPNVTSLKPQASVIFGRNFSFSRIRSKCHSDRFSFVPWQLFGAICSLEIEEALQQSLTDGQESWWDENAKHIIYDEYHCHECITVMKESCMVIHGCVAKNLSLCVCRHTKRSQKRQFCSHHQPEVVPCEKLYYTLPIKFWTSQVRSLSPVLLEETLPI